MKKKFKFIAALGCMALLCVGAGCAKKTAVEEYQDKGYKISVTYDANGGSFMNRPGISIVDMFNPDDYQTGADGKVHISLIEPNVPSRPTSAGDPITLTKQSHFFAGWYQTRTIKTLDGKPEEEGGVPIDDNGRQLEKQEDGTYRYVDATDEEKDLEVTPAYDYDDYWDFKTDTIDYLESDYKSTGGKCEITLYAGWVKFYEFHYYYQKDGVWTKLDQTTAFDYKTTNAEGSKTADKDTIWLPDWYEGAMNYSYKYSDNSAFTFPSVNGTTFKKAYTDEACTQEIVGSFEHQGSLDLEHGKAINPIQNIYLVLEEGERYHIENAAQLCSNPNQEGWYEIAGDLDFTDLKWPALFSSTTFNGKMYGKDGATVTFKNLSVAVVSTTAKVGGIFGGLSDKASIENIRFDNVTVDVVTIGERNHNAMFGFFAGMIDDKAVVNDVTISGTFKLGYLTRANNLEFHTVANGKTTGITKESVQLVVYGTKLSDAYAYSIKPETVKVEADGSITLEFANLKLENENYIIQ